MTDLIMSEGLLLQILQVKKSLLCIPYTEINLPPSGDRDNFIHFSFTAPTFFFSHNDQNKHSSIFKLSGTNKTEIGEPVSVQMAKPQTNIFLTRCLLSQ